MLAYNCSPSFNWKKHLSDEEIGSFQRKSLEKWDEQISFSLHSLVIHTQNIAIFELAEKYKKEGMTAYSKIQQHEFAKRKRWIH